MISIFIVENHEVVRAGLKLVLEQSGEIVVVGDCSLDSEGQLVEKVLVTRPNIVIVSVSSSDNKGINFIRRLRENKPDQKVIIFAEHANDALSQLACLATNGYATNGYLMKTCSSDNLLNAVRAVINGNSWLDPTIAIGILRSSISSQPELNNKAAAKMLSKREQEVLGLIVAGHKNSAVAEQLSISVETVKTHIRHIMEKLQVKSRTKVAVKAIKLGL